MTAAGRVELGLRENAAQFSLLVAVNAFVGAMVGLERSTLPLIGSDDFGLASKTAVLSFIVAFGLAKALTNLGAGALAARLGRRRLLIAGWLIALPVPLLIALAPDWGWIVAANLLLGANQGLAWSMTVVMKIDLVGPRRRGLALGLNEAAGYGGVALAAAVTGWLASDYAARDVLVLAGAVIAILALAASVLFVRDTADHVALEQARHHDSAESAPSLPRAFSDATWRRPALRACSQAGLVNNLNDALAWGLIPLFLAAHGATVAEIGLVAGLYPAVWGVGQIWTGHLSDRLGRKPLIVAGMLVQAAALALLAASDAAIGVASVSAVALGAGTALVYPTLIAAMSDAVSPVAVPRSSASTASGATWATSREVSSRARSPTRSASAVPSLRSPGSPRPQASGSRSICAASGRTGQPHPWANRSPPPRPGDPLGRPNLRPSPTVKITRVYELTDRGRALLAAVAPRGDLSA